jgi:sarcosine oxidase subunit gamma
MPEVGIRLDHAGQRALVRFRVRMADADRAAVALSLPASPLTAAGQDPVALWVSPDQWLIMSETLSPAALVQRCEQALRDVLNIVTDVSDALICIVVEGARARDLLAMGSGVDFDARTFPPGRCVRTRFAKIAVVIHAVAEERFEVICDRSLAHYVGQWLERAARDPLLAARGAK